MPAWTTEAYYVKSMREFGELKNKAVLHNLLHRFVVQTGKQDEFLNWVAKEMGIDQPMDLTRLDALIERVRTVGQPSR